ncbi:MAG TPA: DUF3106 domain-containing protein [Bryobacteraceae bacterium]|nr:DUF3106 domain-containing protein [Bryobacteraceae bacterium]
MNRILQIGSILLLAGAGATYGSDSQAKEAPPPKAAPAKPGRGGVPKQPIPKGAARLVNPANVAARLFRMSPEERERAIASLPREQQRDRARKLLEWFDSLPKAQQDMQLRRMDRFAQLPPEKRAEVMGFMVEVNNFPRPRANAVRQALYRLQQMNDEERERTMARPAFQARFSPEELRVIRGLADAWMGPVQ